MMHVEANTGKAAPSGFFSFFFAEAKTIPKIT
jgi:hypothetical protein